MMKFPTMKSSVCLIGMLSAFLMGCANWEHLNLEGSESNKFDTKNERYDKTSLTEEEAFLIACEALDRRPFSRHSDDCAYNLEYIVAKGATRSVDNDTLAYIFNMEDDMGFAVVAKDGRENPVLAFADEGRFDVSNKTLNESFVEPLVNYLLGTENIGIVRPPIPDIPAIRFYGPTLGAPLGQWTPYNEAVNRKHPGFPVGCVAVATAQIALHSMDTLANYHGRTVYLESIRNALKYKSSNTPVSRYSNRYGPVYTYEECLDSLSEFLYLLSEDLNTKYSEYTRDGVTHKVSLANSANSRKLLQNLGFKIMTEYKKFDVMEAIDLLSEESLIYIDGREKDNEWNGHGFVSDGYKVSIYSDGRVEDPYLHIDWGWEGTSNGFFLGEVFESAWGDYKPTWMFAVKSFRYNYLWPPVLIDKK